MYKKDSINCDFPCTGIHQIQILIVLFCSDGPEQLQKKLIQFHSREVTSSVVGFNLPCQVPSVRNETG